MLLFYFQKVCGSYSVHYGKFLHEITENHHRDNKEDMVVAKAHNALYAT